MNNEEKQILVNIIGAVESGGQIYGKRDYSIYAGAYHTTPSEVTCTLGWCCFYGSAAKRLIQRIYDTDSKMFKEIDKDGLIQKMLDVDWVKTRWNPSDAEADVLKKLIITDVGKKCQDDLFLESTESTIKSLLDFDPTMSIQAQMMCFEIAHLGGINCVKNRILPRITKPYTVDKILESLKKDQDDLSSNNQVGDKLYWSRHEKCAEWIKKYVLEKELKGETNMGTNYMANWSWGESGGYEQKPGVQSGESVTIKAWYSRPWDGILRYKDINVARHVAADYAKLCKSKLCGYDMSWANGRNTLYEALKANGWNMDKYIASGKLTEADCSSSVYSVWCCYVPEMREYYEKTSYNDYKYHNCTTTYVMKQTWKKWGFTWLTDSKYRTGGNYQYPGDVYLNESHHTNMAINYGASTGKSQTIEYTLASAPNNATSNATVTTPTVTENKVTTSAINSKFEITATSLNIRANYNTASTILGEYKKGDIVTAIQKASNGWYKTDKGWISGQYVKAYVEPVKPVETKPTIPITSLDAKSKEIFTVSKKTAPNNTKQFTGTVTVSPTTTTLSVRKNPGATSPLCTTFTPKLAHGTKIGVCDAILAQDGTKWYFAEIDVNGTKKYGYVWAACVK